MKNIRCKMSYTAKVQRNTAKGHVPTEKHYGMKLKISDFIPFNRHRYLNFTIFGTDICMAPVETGTVNLTVTLFDQ